MENPSETYNGNFNSFVAFSELVLLSTICKDFISTNYKETVKTLQPVSQDQRNLISNVVAVISILLTNGASFATPECLFTMARRLKTWLRSTMSQKTFNS